MRFGGTVASLIALGLAPDAWRTLFVIGGVAPLVIGAVMAAGLREGRGANGEARPVGPISDLFADGRQARTLTLWVGFFAAALTLHLMLNWLPLLLQGRGLAKSDAVAAQVAFNLMG